MTDHDHPHCAGCILAIRHDLERPTMTDTEAREALREAAETYMVHVQALACDHDGAGGGTHTGCPEALGLRAALAVAAETALRAAADAINLLDSMVRSGERHSDASLLVVRAGRAALASEDRP
jgi:hypothetical protein